MIAKSASTAPLVDARGRRITLGPQLARGGEGSVYPVTDRPDLVAKVYHGPVSAEKAAKLAAMARLPSDRLRRLAAWPMDTLHDRSGGMVRGILMPRVQDHRELHVLYGPKTRLQEFPDAGLPFLVHAAANVARAFAVIHEHGHVIGDVNHGSVLVSKQGTVTLVDCDSFQIRDGQRHYFCTVGVPTHTPPELQGKSFAGLVRTPNHDAFGLAVLIFQLLFLGRHPFSGTFLGTGELSLERAIEEHRFAYGPGATTRQMRQPPATPPLTVATPAVAGLFERAFARSSNGPAARPAARDWVNVLAEAAKQLVVCARHNGHYYPRSFGTCPWCAIETATGLVLFNVALVGVSPARPGQVFDLEAVWARIAAVPDPGPPPPLPGPATLPISPSPVATGQGVAWRPWDTAMKAATVGAVVVGLLGCVLSEVSAVSGWLLTLAMSLAAVAGVIYYRRRTSPERVAATRAVQVARTNLYDIERRWGAGAGNDAFLTQRRELERQRDAYRELAALRQRKVQDLTANLRQRQLERFLDRQRIAAASISNIGPGRKATLQSYGIETAADVTQAAVRRVPGFGPSLTGNLLAWRHGIERCFVFDPQRGIDPADLAAIDREIEAKRAQLERTLHEGATQLQRTARQVVAVRTTLRPAVEQARLALAQAEANLRVL